MKISEQKNATKSDLKFNTAVSFFEYLPVPNALQNRAFPVASNVEKAKIKYLSTRFHFPFPVFSCFAYYFKHSLMRIL